MSAKEILTRLRELLAETDLRLTQLSRRSGVPYGKLRRFAKKGKPLSIDDAEKLHLELTGTTFITEL